MMFFPRFLASFAVPASLILCVFLLPSCGGSIEPDKANEPPIGGIVRTAQSGRILEEDASDWQPRLVKMSSDWEQVVEVPSASVAFGPPYPNPSAATTRFEVAIPERGRITLWAVNANGSTVKTIVDNDGFVAGVYALEWDLKDDAGNDLPNGLYRIYVRILYGSKSTEVKSFGDVEIAR